MRNSLQNQLSKNSKGIIWYNRLLISLVTILFISLGMRYSFHTVESAKEAGIAIETAMGIAAGRANLGGWPFAFALILISCLISKNNLLIGIRIVFITFLVITLMRGIGYVIEGVAPFIVPEIVVAILSGIGLFLEARRTAGISNIK
jgi:hypothetical protein